MPTRYTITMFILNPVTGELRLLPPAAGVNRGDTISWRKDVRIESFQIVAKHSGSTPIFTTSLPGPVTSLDMIVHSNAPFGEWWYSIIWTDTATHTQHTFDPKISVNPHSHISFLKIILAAVSMALTALLAFLFLRSNKVRSRQRDSK